MISKELLSEVLNEDIEHIYDKSDMGENYIYYTPKIGCNVDINIYELAHKCKKYFFDLGFIWWYERGVGIYIKELYSSKALICLYSTKQKHPLDIEIDFKACQWILENKES